MTDTTGVPPVGSVADVVPGHRSSPTSSLLDLIYLEEALQALLGTHVDVVSAGALVEIHGDAVPL